MAGFALVLTLLLFALPSPAAAVPLRARDTLDLLPASSVLCVVTPGTVSADDAFAGRCAGRAAKLPAEVWYRIEVAPGNGEALLIATDVYTAKGGSLTLWDRGGREQRVSTAQPLSARPIRDGRLALAAPLDRIAETPLVARLSLRDSRHLREPQSLLQITTRDGWAAEQSTRTFVQGLFFGLLAIMVLYNGFLFYAERHLASGWYAAALTAAGLYFGITRNIGPLFFWSQIPWLSQLLYPATAPALLALALSFARSYARMGRHGDRAVRLGAIANWVVALFAGVADPLGYVALAATVVNVFIAIGLLTLFISCIAAARRGDRPALVLLSSWMAPIAGAFAQIGVMSGLIRPSPFISMVLQLGLAIQVVILGLGLADRVRHLRADRDRSEAVLHLALPAKIAERLKAGETAIADHHDEVAVLFADLAGFTALSAQRSPEEVVQLLDALFSEFDALALRQGAEKIKTIGDCYMVVAGAPHAHPDPAAALADLALELPAATARALAHIRARGAAVPEEVSLRVGLHLGPVVAGVLGQQRLAYDLWGDTVNTASRMESHGVVGRVQCTESVAERLRDRYHLEPRGDIAVRGKGSIKTWFLLSRK